LAILFEDFVDRTHEVFEDVLKFLGLESDKRINFPRINLYKTHRLSLINRWLLGRPPFWLIKSLETIKMRVKIESLSVYPLLMKYNVSKDKRRPLEPATRRTIIDVFSQNIDRGSLLDVDIGHWKGQH
jgi:hypothetical protein